MQGFNAPGKFNRSSASLAKQITRETEVDGATFGFVTEVADPDRAAALGVNGHWTVTHDGGRGKGECAILTKDAKRKVVAAEWLTIHDGGGPGRLSAPIVAPCVITKAPSGRWTLYTTAHLPAHVEGIWRAIPLPARTKAKILLKSKRARIVLYLEALTSWRHQVTHLAAKYHVDDIVVGADWNLDGDKGWVQDLIGNTWPGLTMARTKAPDLGRRNVGWLLTTMEKTVGSVHPSPASDHRVGRFTLHHVNKPPVKVTTAPAPFEKVTYNGALMDQKTKTFVQTMEAKLGYALTILQGCYNPGGVSQSAGTHDGGGVVDLAPFDHDNKVRVARELGGFYWHRLPIPGVWGEHIHGGIRNHGRLSPSAAAQQVDYDAHPPRDGLAGHNLDPTFHPVPPVAFSYLPNWHKIND